MIVKHLFLSYNTFVHTYSLVFIYVSCCRLSIVLLQTTNRGFARCDGGSGDRACIPFRCFKSSPIPRCNRWPDKAAIRTGKAGEATVELPDLPVAPDDDTSVIYKHIMPTVMENLKKLAQLHPAKRPAFADECIKQIEKQIPLQDVRENVIQLFTLAWHTL